MSAGEPVIWTWATPGTRRMTATISLPKTARPRSRFAKPNVACSDARIAGCTFSQRYAGEMCTVALRVTKRGLKMLTLISMFEPSCEPGTFRRLPSTALSACSEVLSSPAISLPSPFFKWLILWYDTTPEHRVLPIAWIVVKGSKEHFPEEIHVKLLEQVHAVVPEGAGVVFLGDGEFDGITLQTKLDLYGWAYVCRTAKNIILYVDGEEFACEEVGVIPWDPPISLPDVAFTRRAYSPVHAVACWKEKYEDPLHLVTSLELAEEACYWYEKRFQIETFFSDRKSRGFHLHKSHISDPVRLSRLMIAASLAYI